jgi:NADPH2:quinone reductase
MRAILCKKYGPPESLVLEEIDPPACGPHAVRVAVHAAAVNFPDVLIIAGKYQFQPPFPFSPGGELAGEVIEVGAAVEGFAVGDRVLGVTGWGAFAEEAVVPAAKCFHLPPQMDFETGAAFGMTYGTSYYALVQRGRLAAGETLIVHGATGGVGTAAVEIGKCLGARVIATAGSDDKLEALRAACEIDDALNYSTETDLKAALKRITGGKGADVIFDPVGGPLFEPSLRSLAWGGRLLVVGFASGEIPAAKANLLLLKGSSVVGVFWGAFATREPEVNASNFAQLLSWFAEGRLRPLVTRRFRLEDAGAAISALVDRAVVGKAIVTMRD